jgi:hypothetical protein
MSQLFFTETGRVISTLGEEVTFYRRARKILRLPPTTLPGSLYVLVRPYQISSPPLRLTVNGCEAAPIQPYASQAFFWHEVWLDPAWLKSGTNTFEFWADATSMVAWGLALEGGQAQPDSYISDDAGATWRNEKMGYLNATRAEYIVRVRLAEGQDPPPPAFTWENVQHPRLDSLRARLPAELLQPVPFLDRVRTLSSWISQMGSRRAAGVALQYAPWDAETILDWSIAQQGHDGRLPIIMCVQYGVAFVICCQALGLRARCNVLTTGITSYNGHFASEVWSYEHAKWIFVDADFDIMFAADGVPLSVAEMRAAGAELEKLVTYGPAAAVPRHLPAVEEYIQTHMLTGAFIGHRSLWPRTDFLSHPELTPPGHGVTAFSETELVWEVSNQQAGYGMFPNFAQADYFDAPPQVD